MEKIIKIGDYKIPVKSTAASLFIYKANFKRDALKDLFVLAPALEKLEKGDGDISAFAESDFELDIFYRFLWVFAKAKNKDIPPLEDWLETFDIPPLDFMSAALPEVIDMLIGAAGTTVKSKNARAAKGTQTK